MNYKLKVIMNLVIAALLVAASRGGNPAGNARLERQDPQPEFGSAAAKFHPAQAASQTLSSALAASTNLSATVYSWVKTWGGSSDEVGAGLAVDGAGNVYVSGYFNGTVDLDPGPGVDSHTSNGGRDVFLSKFDANGNFIWTRTWGGSGDERGESVAVDSSGNVYVAGPFRMTVDFDPGSGVDSHTAPGVGSDNDAFLSKFDSNGNFQWAKTWGGIYGDEAYCVVVDRSGNAYVVGDFSSPTVDFDPGPGVDNHTMHGFFDAFLTKFVSDGTFLWARTWGGEGYDDGPGVAVDSLGNVYVAGMYGSTDPNLNFDPAGGAGGLGHQAHDSGSIVDVFLSKFDSSGTFQWVATWGAQGNDDVGQNVVVDGANNVYVGGRFGCSAFAVNCTPRSCDFNPGAGIDYHTSNGFLDAFVSKFDSSGTFQWVKTWGGTGVDAESGLATDSSNNLYVTGIFSNTVDFGSGSGVLSNGLWDASLSKFDANGIFQWVKTWGGTGDDGNNKVARDMAGNVYVVGWFHGAVDFDPGSSVDTHTALGGSDAFLSKFASFPLQLRGTPGDRTIYLNWKVNVTLPVTATWTISYTGGPGNPASPITGLGEPTRTYVITNATNYIWYDITLNAMVDGSADLTDTVRVMPTDRFVYLPLIMRQ